MNDFPDDSETPTVTSIGQSRWRPRPLPLAERSGEESPDETSSVSSWRLGSRDATRFDSSGYSSGDDITNSPSDSQAFLKASEIGRSFADRELADLRSRGTVAGDPITLPLLITLCERGELGSAVLSENIESAVDMARAHLLFMAAGRAFPTLEAFVFLDELTNTFSPQSVR